MMHQITLADTPAAVYRHIDDALEPLHPEEGYVRVLHKVKISQFSTACEMDRGRLARKYLFVATFDPHHVRIPEESNWQWSAQFKLRESEDKRYKKAGRLSIAGLWIFTMDSLDSKVVPLMGYENKIDMRKQLGHHKHNDYALTNSDVVCAWRIHQVVY